MRPDAILPFICAAESSSCARMKMAAGRKNWPCGLTTARAGRRRTKERYAYTVDSRSKDEKRTQNTRTGRAGRHARAPIWGTTRGDIEQHDGSTSAARRQKEGGERSREASRQPKHPSSHVRPQHSSRPRASPRRLRSDQVADDRRYIDIA
ncbi:hypothetical protein FKP32DRAFT_596986 [Trametes sanguinea]|nr:hypothetical protein FKP32DRAFT_596986 [Trametes sanguinea]